MTIIELMYYRLIKWIEHVNSTPVESATSIFSLFNGYTVAIGIGILKYGLHINIHFESKIIPAFIMIFILLLNYFFLENRSSHIISVYSQKPKSEQRKGNFLLLAYIFLIIISIIVIMYVQKAGLFG